MRRLSGLLLAGAIMLLPAFSQDLGTANAQDALTFNGDTALWSIAIKPDKTADFEQVMMKVRDALMKSETPQRKQTGGRLEGRQGRDADAGRQRRVHPRDQSRDQGRGLWDHGDPVRRVPDPAEQKVLYDLYSGSFGAALGANVGTTAVDLSRP